MAEPVKTQAVTLVMFLPAGQIFRAFRDGRGDNDEGDIGIPVIGVRFHPRQAFFPGGMVQFPEKFLVQAVCKGKKYIFVGFCLADGRGFCEKIGAAV